MHSACGCRLRECCHGSKPDKGSVPTISSSPANPTSINSGASTTLGWKASGATNIATTPGSFTSTAASGSVNVSPFATTTYTLTAANASGSATATVKVTVNAAPNSVGTGTPSAPNGAVKHPVRFTLNHMLNYWVWPATETAGVGSCTASGGGTIPTSTLISQSAPPASCSMTAPDREIYRLKASVPSLSCAAT